eukprot:scaffold733_cov267-Pinguiococcus_pyrenoidosus.AAC.13
MAVLGTRAELAGKAAAAFVRRLESRSSGCRPGRSWGALASPADLSLGSGCGMTTRSHLSSLSFAGIFSTSSSDSSPKVRYTMCSSPLTSGRYRFCLLFRLCRVSSKSEGPRTPEAPSVVASEPLLASCFAASMASLRSSNTMASLFSTDAI